MALPAPLETARAGPGRCASEPGGAGRGPQPRKVGSRGAAMRAGGAFRRAVSGLSEGGPGLSVADGGGSEPEPAGVVKADPQVPRTPVS